ncbi:HepT-like ribonuclease domain-containing protein [Cellulomonas hominis]
MSDDERVVRRLQDLVTFAAEAAHIVSRGRDAYLADSAEGALLRNAGERVLIKVATVAEKLPADYTAAHGSVAWVAIGRMRSLVAHHYDKVNDDMMWAALSRRVPEMVRSLGLVRQEP